MNRIGGRSFVLKFDGALSPFHGSSFTTGWGGRVIHEVIAAGPDGNEGKMLLPYCLKGTIYETEFSFLSLLP